MIETKRLTLKKLDEEDKEKFFSYRSMEEVMLYQSFKPKTLLDIDSFYDKLADKWDIPDTWYQLGIYLKESENLIGDLGIHFVDDRQCEFGITLNPSFQRKGYAYEAGYAVIDYLFIKMNKHRIYGSVDPNNTASIHLLEKLGMRKEAHFIKSYFMDKKWHDDCIYAVLHDEWTRYKNNPSF